MKNSVRLAVILAACLVAGAAVLRSEDAPVAAGTPRDVAADGTVSVVVEPPATAVARDPATPAPNASEAATLLGALLEPFAVEPHHMLHERPLPLLEALERSGDRSRRLWITQAYWKASAAFAALRQATGAVERLELVAPGAAEHDRAVVESLVAAARAERSEAQSALVTAQQELVDLVRLPPGEPLPWPVDRPLVAPYQTHFDTIFATRVATGRVRSVNRTLPLRHEAIEARAAAVRVAAEVFGLAEQQHAQGRMSIGDLAAAAERLDLQERRFIDDVRHYNNEIAEYVMAVADFSVPDDRFATMLIGAPIPWRQQPAVVAAGATADVPPPTGSVQPPQAPVVVPPPGFLPPAGLQAVQPAIPVVP